MDHISPTPADLRIQPRNVMFGRGRTTQRWWNGGDAVATAFYNSLSLTFPKGEAFFIESVRNFRDSVPAPQQAVRQGLRSHGGLHERHVPIIVTSPLRTPVTRPLTNADIFDLVLNEVA